MKSVFDNWATFFACMDKKYKREKWDKDDDQIDHNLYWNGLAGRYAVPDLEPGCILIPAAAAEVIRAFIDDNNLDKNWAEQLLDQL